VYNDTSLVYNDTSLKCRLECWLGVLTQWWRDYPYTASEFLLSPLMTSLSRTMWRESILRHGLTILSSLWCVTKGLAVAPPAMTFRIGVSTSKKLRSSRYSRSSCFLVCRYMYMYTYIHIYIYVHQHKFKYINACIHRCIFIFVFICTSMYLCM